MTVIRNPRRYVSALASLSLMALAACGRVPGQFEILNDQVPTTGCSIPIMPTVYTGKGKLDLSIVPATASTAYLFFPLVENNLPGAGASSNTIDPNQIQLSGFNVDIGTVGIVPPAAQPALAAAGTSLHFRVPWSGGVDSNGGQISAAVEVFPVSLAQALLASGAFGPAPTLTVDLQVQAIGRTNAGTEMQSDPFHFPVEVCAGCLVANVSSCPYQAAPTNPGNACNPAQDTPVDCCTDKGTLICPPAVATQ